MRRLALPLALVTAGAIALAYDAGRRRERAPIGGDLVERDRRLGIRPAAVRLALAADADAIALMDAPAPVARDADTPEGQLARIEAAVREARITAKEAAEYIDFPPVTYPDGASPTRRYRVRQCHLAAYSDLVDKVRREADLSGDLSGLFALARASSRLVDPSSAPHTAGESGVVP